MFHTTSMMTLKETIKQKLKSAFNSYKALSISHLLVSHYRLIKYSSYDC